MLHKPILTQSKAWLLYVCLLTMLAGCSKCNKVIEPAGNQTSTAGLPPATQTGAKTFACMLNGRVWVPRGQNSGLYARSNPNLYYDPTFQGGYLQAFAARYDESTIIFEGGNISALGEYTEKNSNIRIVYREYPLSEDSNYDNSECISTYKLVLTKNNIQNNIFSGTFEFSMEKRDTGKKVVAASGRFDMKYL